MANWRTLCKMALLADGTIDDREVEIIRKEFFADGRIDRTELEFLLEVRRRLLDVGISGCTRARFRLNAQVEMVLAVRRFGDDRQTFSIRQCFPIRHRDRGDKVDLSRQQCRHTSRPVLTVRALPVVRLMSERAARRPLCVTIDR